MSRKSPWSDKEFLSAVIRQLAVDNGTPNIMPTYDDMSAYPGLSSWVKTKEGGTKRLSDKLKMVMKPNIMPNSNNNPFYQHSVMKGATVLVHNLNNITPAIVIDKNGKPGGLKVMVLNTKMAIKNVQYGKTASRHFQWCYVSDLPKGAVTIEV